MPLEPLDDDDLSDDGQDEISIRTITHAVYGLYVAGVLLGITGVVGLVVVLMKREEAWGTECASHFIWLIRTFWIGAVGGGIGLAALPLGFGLPILGVTASWVLWRVARGWRTLAAGEPLARPRAWM